MDILCTDKTGTLTMDKVVLERYCDVALREGEGVLALAYMNSHFQTGLKNVLDRAVLAHERNARPRPHPGVQPRWTRSRSTSNDASCRSSSARPRARTASSRRVLPRRSSQAAPASKLDGKRLPMDHAHIEELKKEYERLSADGFRVLALATKDVAAEAGGRRRRDALWQGRRMRPDPARATSRSSIRRRRPRRARSRTCRVTASRSRSITGDNDLVARRRFASDVGLKSTRRVLGDRRREA